MRLDRLAPQPLGVLVAVVDMASSWARPYVPVLRLNHPPGLHPSSRRPTGPALPSSRADLELTILMPCLNEAETLAACIDKAQGFLERTGVHGRSYHRRQRLDRRLPGDRARSSVRASSTSRSEATEPPSITGAQAARGRYVIMGDCRRQLRLLGPRAASWRSSARATTWSWATASRAASARRHAVEEPLHRQPGAVGARPAALPRPGRATSTAACAASRATPSSGWTCRRPAWNSPARWSSRRRCSA